MRSRLAKACGAEYPIFAFSHCRDVVIEVSRSGGVGVLGLVRSTPEQVELDLRVISEALDGKPFGVDVLFPVGDIPTDKAELSARIPDEHRRFVAEIMARYNVPEGDIPDAVVAGVAGGAKATMQDGLEIGEVALKYGAKVVASALGPPPPPFVDQVRESGALLFGLCGGGDQARRHVAAGADAVVAQGTEAGGHTGDLATMVVVPEVVDAISPVPVLAAGGISDGRQIAAGLALGADAVWTGSIWLGTVESELDPIVKQKLVDARSRDTLRSRCISGKTVRQLRTPWVELWEGEDAPRTLPMPLQGMLVAESQRRIFRHRVAELMGTPAGQAIGRINAIRPTREVFYDLVQGFADASSRFTDLLDD
ncbi:MAG TPA: nitronate monooxygenase family protein [Pseudonocardia sp.]|jgi:NAD(P)H-dependent flavin oxidoreductase YrpB (nitropropane dioxygenase family)|nr:nitronate monooxygenase family protein [Pseudonocardia sp.]